jgi:hypothetical protein
VTRLYAVGPAICLQTAEMLWPTRVESFAESAPSFFTTQNFATVANFSVRTVEGNFNPAFLQSLRNTSV